MKTVPAVPPEARRGARPLLALLPFLVCAALSSPALAADADPDAEGDEPEADIAEFPLADDDAPEAPHGPRSAGYLQFDLARTYAEPEHWSMARVRGEFALQGSNGGVKWKTSARADADAVFGIESGFYPDEVRRDQQYRFDLRENYVSFSSGDLEMRLGRQHIVWGEMVGLFFADVVSARDLRTFFLPEFEQMRIPQWAARAEYYAGDTHAELVFIPVPSYDQIGKPGGEFYPLPVPGARVRGEVKPANSPGATNWGGRVSTLAGGWDLSAFYYRSLDVSPTFVTVGPNEFEPRHLRISQAGGTIGKDFGPFVLKSEFVHTRGRQFNNQFDPFVSDPMISQGTVDYAVGIDVPAFNDGRINLQYFGRRVSGYDERIGLERVSDGASVMLNTKFAGRWEAEALLISMLDRSDFMFRPKLVWSANRSWRLSFGIDAFGGDPNGLFGRYDKRDRAWAQARFSF